MSDIFNTINSSTPNSVARAIANEVVAGKNAIASSLSNKGQLVEITDTFETMAQKILSITGEVNVTPLQGLPSNWHDLSQVIASNTLAEYPYSFAILLSKGMKSIQLTGSNRYITSDGGFFSGDRMHVFDESKDNVGQDTQANFSGLLCGMSTPVTIVSNEAGSVGNIKLIGNGTSIDTLISEWNSANPTKQITLISGDGTQIPTSGFKGVVQGMVTPVYICQNSGGDFGNITIVANSIKTINTLISEWNSANPTKQVTLISGDGTQIPTSNITLITEDILLTGGVIGNEGKVTRWVIFLNNESNSSPTYDFQTTTNNESETVDGRLLYVIFQNANKQNVKLNSYVNYVLLQGGTKLRILPNEFYHNSVGGSVNSLIIPGSVQDVVIESSGLYASSLKFIDFREGIKNITFYSLSFMNNKRISHVVFPKGLDLLRIIDGGSNSGAFYGCSNLDYIYLSNPKQTFQIGQPFRYCTRLSYIELEPEWNWPLTLYVAAYGSTDMPLSRESILGMFNALVDKRKDGVNPTTVTVVVGSKIVSAINGNFTKVFHIGESITIEGNTARAIESIEDDNNLTLTSSIAVGGSNLSYNINKTLNLGAINLGKMTSTELLIATDKGWTLL